MYQGEFGPVSNRAAWSESISLKTSALGGAAVLAPDIEEIELAFGRRCSTKLTKKLTADEIIYDAEAGIFSFIIPEAEMRRFDPGAIDMGITVTIDGIEEQLFAGTLVIADGVVS